jgi:hypothetical protein
MAIRRESSELRPIVRLNVILERHAAVPRILALIEAIRAWPEVAALTWDFAEATKLADCELRDRLMALLGQVAPL